MAISHAHVYDCNIYHIGVLDINVMQIKGMKTTLDMPMKENKKETCISQKKIWS